MGLIKLGEWPSVQPMLLLTHRDAPPIRMNASNKCTSTP
jgi:hypothetical protein